jgi:hypothetical protein
LLTFRDWRRKASMKEAIRALFMAAHDPWRGNLDRAES